MKDPFLEKRIMRSIIQSGLLPGGASERTGNKYSSPDVRQKKDLEEVQYDLDKPRVGVYTNTWKSHHHTVYWCNLRLAQRKGLQFYQTRSHAITLSSALLAICIEKVVCMKTGTELYCKVCQSPRLPRVTLTPNPQHSLKDPPNLDARQSDNYESEMREHRRTCSGKLDFRIPGIPHSTVGQVDTNRKETVKRLIEQFENHPNRNVLLKAFQKAEEINHFSKEPKNLITDMLDTDIFELFETMLRWSFVLGNWIRILHMRQIHANYGTESTVQQKQIWRIVDSWIRDKEGRIPRC